MGFVPNLLGVGDSPGGDFQASKVPVLQPATLDQANQVYGQVQQGLSGQLGGINQQQAFVNALAGANGIQNQSQVFGQQQALANQLQGVADGTGPNPALAQLNQTTGNNIAAQAALMAGQRGSGSNVGLLARQIGQQGAGIQQQAVGQAATMGAQQQIAGMQALGQQQSNMANLANTQVGQQAQGIVGLTQAQTGYSQAAQNAQGQILGSIANYNNANTGQQNAVNAANAGIASTVARGQSDLVGGLIGAAGTAAVAAKAHGGMIEKYASGGAVSGPRSNAGQFLNGWSGSDYQVLPMASMPEMPSEAPSNPKLVKGAQQFGSGMMNAAQRAFAAPPPDLQYSPPQPDYNLGNMSSQFGPAPMPMAPSYGFLSGGGKVPGQAPVQGDSLTNDTVPAVLSPGEIVIPRHITLGKNPAENAKKFVAAILAKKGAMQ